MELKCNRIISSHTKDMAFCYSKIYEKENVYIKNMDVGCKTWEPTPIEPVKVRHPTKLSVYIAESHYLG